jgi:hypothetical protein
VACVTGKTTVPLPRREPTSPSDFNREIASRITVRLTEKRSVNSISDGKRTSGANSPLRICCASTLVTWSASVVLPRAAAAMDASADACGLEEEVFMARMIPRRHGLL